MAERIAKAEISYFEPRTRNKTVAMVRHIAAMAAMAANSRGYVSLASAYLAAGAAMEPWAGHKAYKEQSQYTKQYTGAATRTTEN